MGAKPSQRTSVGDTWRRVANALIARVEARDRQSRPRCGAGDPQPRPRRGAGKHHQVLALGPLALPILLAISGCQAVQTTTNGAQIRFIDASPDAPGLDFYTGNAALAYNLGFSYVTSYIPMDPGTYTITADTAGSRQVLSSAKGTLSGASQYTVLVGNVAADLQQTILKDQSQPAPTGQIDLRFLDQATRIGAIDIYLVPAGQKLAAVTPVLTNVNFPTNSGYLPVPTGAYTLIIVPTGTVPTATTVATYTGPQVTYTAGSATTIVLVDQQLVTTPGVQVISAPDYISPVATS